jgi:hypothetical protein
MHFIIQSDFDSSLKVVAGLLPGLRLMVLDSFAVLIPIFQPHPLDTLSTFGVRAAVKETLMKMYNLRIAYTNPDCVARPVVLLATVHLL